MAAGLLAEYRIRDDRLQNPDSRPGRSPARASKGRAGGTGSVGFAQTRGRRASAMIEKMESRRRREGGRGRRAAPTHLRQLPWRAVRNPYAPMEVLTADQLEAIHLTSLRILEELGIELRSPQGCEIMRAAGGAGRR